MNTPICDFVRRYASENALRLHMPGHKGVNLLGCENIDITEINGADSMYEAQGIIKESEDNTSALFGCATYYSTEGSSQCIRAMLYLATLFAKENGRKPLVYAGRNAHKTFISAAALIGFDIEWLYPQENEFYLSCTINPADLDKKIREAEHKPVAIYLTSPDYLGNLADIQGISQVCRKHDVLLLVDNAHGAYLKFLENSQHPVDLGADICCSSAHKTLPVLTGGAYLHISGKAPALFTEKAKDALMLFGSTSPSYVILQSLDMANKYMDSDYRENLKSHISLIDKLKSDLTESGYTLTGTEPLKITICTKPYGYKGTDFARILESHNIICEFCDPDFVVLMTTPEISADHINKLYQILINIPTLSPIEEVPPVFSKPQKAMSVREAVFSQSEVIHIQNSKGRILASAGVSCPPAVPLIVCGEVIDEATIKNFMYYGIDTCTVVKQNT